MEDGRLARPIGGTRDVDYLFRQVAPELSGNLFSQYVSGN
jgi:hypothetical protein